MKKIRKRSFTLVELLAVIGILSLLFGIFVPAFNRMMIGSKVDQMASNFKTGMEVAQAKAVASRKYVAMILPGNYDAVTDNRLKPYCNGGYRLAYVRKSGGEWLFAGWVPGASWTNAADGAMLVSVQSGKNWYEDEDESDPDNPRELKDLPGVVTSSDKSMFWDGDDSSRKSQLVRVRLNDSTGDDPDSDHDDPDMVAMGSGSNGRENRSAIIFSPFGGCMEHTVPLLFFFTEAKLESGDYIYPNKDNFLVLKLNPITGKVLYQAEGND